MQTAPPATILLPLPADLLPLLRELADDARVWANRLAHDAGGQSDPESGARHQAAWARAADAGRIVRACDAAMAPAPVKAAA